MTKKVKEWAMPAGITMGTITAVITLLWSSFAQPIVDTTVKTALTPVNAEIAIMKLDIFEIKYLMYKLAGDSLVQQMKRETAFVKPRGLSK